MTKLHCLLTRFLFILKGAQDEKNLQPVYRMLKLCLNDLNADL